jgi:fructose-1,6-bisphosphatase
MAYQQKDYDISAKDNEYYQVLSIAKNLLVKANNEGRYPVWGETLEKLIKELEENKGDNVTPWQYNFIISILLDHVPEDLKRDLD